MRSIMLSDTRMGSFCSDDVRLDAESAPESLMAEICAWAVDAVPDQNIICSWLSSLSGSARLDIDQGTKFSPTLALLASAEFWERAKSTLATAVSTGEGQSLPAWSLARQTPAMLFSVSQRNALVQTFADMGLDGANAVAMAGSRDSLVWALSGVDAGQVSKTIDIASFLGPQISVTGLEGHELSSALRSSSALVAKWTLGILNTADAGSAEAWSSLVALSDTFVKQAASSFITDDLRLRIFSAFFEVLNR